MFVRQLVILLFIAAAMNLASDAEARTRSEPRYVDRAGLLDLAGAAIGAKFKAIPKTVAKSEQCVEDFKRPYFDCEYVGANGARYTMINPVLARIEIPNVQTFKGKLPASVQRGDSSATVLAKLKSRIACKSCCKRVDYNDLGGESVVCGSYFVSRHGDEFSMDFDFDASGKLVRILSMTLTN